MNYESDIWHFKEVNAIQTYLCFLGLSFPDKNTLETKGKDVYSTRQRECGTKGEKNLVTMIR